MNIQGNCEIKITFEIKTWILTQAFTKPKNTLKIKKSKRCTNEKYTKACRKIPRSKHIRSPKKSPRNKLDKTRNENDTKNKKPVKNWDEQRTWIKWIFVIERKAVLFYSLFETFIAKSFHKIRRDQLLDVTKWTTPFLQMP